MHVACRFGKSINEGYITQIDGVQVRDLARLQREVFKDPAQVAAQAAQVVLAATTVADRWRFIFWLSVQWVCISGLVGVRL